MEMINYYRHYNLIIILNSAKLFTLEVTKVLPTAQIVLNIHYYPAQLASIPHTPTPQQ